MQYISATSLKYYIECVLEPTKENFDYGKLK